MLSVIKLALRVVGLGVVGGGGFLTFPPLGQKLIEGVSFRPTYTSFMDVVSRHTHTNG